MMDATAGNRVQLGAESLLATMTIGIVGVTGLISLMAVVGEWWLLGVTFAVLLAAAGLVILMILRLLSESGDPCGEAASATPAAPGVEASVAQAPLGRHPALTPALGGV